MSFDCRVGQVSVGAVPGTDLLTEIERSTRPSGGVHRLALGGPVASGDLPALCERVRILVARDTPPLVEVDLAALPRADLATVGVLSRLQLTAKRGGGRICIRHAPEGLGELLILLGLDSCLTIRIEMVG
jgi:ABC-type transporter Mla MlaB component